MFLDNKIEGLRPVYPLKQLKKIRVNPWKVSISIGKHQYKETYVKAGLRQTEEQVTETWCLPRNRAIMACNPYESHLYAFLIHLMLAYDELSHVLRNYSIIGVNDVITTTMTKTSKNNWFYEQNNRKWRVILPLC